MLLHEHPDFDQVVLLAEEHFRERRLRAAILEKDYYVTETLRLAAAAFGPKVIFKGGTSLSKGWNLIQRFSEDIDLFLDPLTFEPPLGKTAIDRQLKRLRDVVDGHSGLTFVGEESQTIGGFGRSDRFAYEQRFGDAGDVRNRVLLEAGTASGREPTAEVALRSYLGEFLEAAGRSLGTENEGSFPFRLLHFRRTFVEKLFAIHGKVRLLEREGRPLGSYARHYYDLYQLAGEGEVLAMLHSDEYAAIKDDYDRISRQHFARDYAPPAGMTFSASDALFPLPALERSLAADFERQCKVLCYGPFPSWPEVRARFESLRALL